MPKRHEAVQRTENVIDTFSEKRGRGRPQTIQRSWVIGRAENYRNNLAQVWPKLRDPLLSSQTNEQVVSAFEKNAQPYAGDFVPRLAADIIRLIRDASFPKRPKAQIGFLAESLAGRPKVEFRTSRDICVKERAKQRARSPYKIIRYEFRIECECGYKGFSRDHACRKCGAGIPFSLGTLMGNPGSS
jgi:hypothetical protein